jgi:hypothetical protein
MTFCANPGKNVTEILAKIKHVCDESHPTFWRNISPPSLRVKNKGSKKALLSMREAVLTVRP